MGKYGFLEKDEETTETAEKQRFCCTDGFFRTHPRNVFKELKKTVVSQRKTISLPHQVESKNPGTGIIRSKLWLLELHSTITHISHWMFGGLISTYDLEKQPMYAFI